MLWAKRILELILLHSLVKRHLGQNDCFSLVDCVEISDYVEMDNLELPWQDFVCRASPLQSGSSVSVFISSLPLSCLLYSFFFF